MRVVFLGSNPSNASPIDEAFTHCKSRATLDGWIAKLGLIASDIEFMNVSNVKTPKNRRLKLSEVQSAVDSLIDNTYGKIVICLGCTAKEAMTLVNKRVPRSYISLPHPSGRNRLLNDSQWLDKTLLEAKEALSLLAK